MLIKNITKQIPLATNARVVRTLSEKTKGLYGTTSPIPLIFKTRFGIHTFGMNYSIDVLVLNKHSRVTALRESMPPNRIFIWNPFSNTVIELPPHTIARTKTELSDLISIS